MKKKIIVKNINETLNLGELLSKHLYPGACVTLEGDLGAGKTTFTKGIAKGLGITDVVNSPTFTIMKNYEGDLQLNHLDAYRLGNIGLDYDLEEYIYGDGVAVVEWAQHIKDSIPRDALNIIITRVDDDVRSFEIETTNDKFLEFLKGVK